MCLFLWQANFFPALGQGSDKTIQKSINGTEKPVNGTVEIVVQHGETLWDLAISHHTTVEEIVKLNRVKNPNNIGEGESLLVPIVQQKSTILTVTKTASRGEDSQALSRSLGHLISKADVEILSRVIHGEARGENFEGQVAVGAVVLNRLKDPRFPKTIRDVVYQEGAFTAVDDKQIQLDPNDQSYKAAEAALAGQDPTNGALFYFNPSIATDNWIKSRAVIKRIGNHTFSI
jgi:LysM repeat protein